MVSVEPEVFGREASRDSSLLLRLHLDIARVARLCTTGGSAGRYVDVQAGSIHFKAVQSMEYCRTCKNQLVMALASTFTSVREPMDVLALFATATLGGSEK